MRKIQCLLFVLKRSYICYCIICKTVPLKTIFILGKPQQTNTCSKLAKDIREQGVIIFKVSKKTKRCHRRRSIVFTGSHLGRILTFQKNILLFASMIALQK